MQAPDMVRITRVINEAQSIKSFMFKSEFQTEPRAGQFLMVWLPDIDEIPLALSYIKSGEGEEFGVTVAKVGEATERFHSLVEGDHIGVRGPYGNGFSFGPAKTILAVGGGIGMAPLAPAVDSALQAGLSVQLAVGAKTQKELLFVDRLKDQGLELQLSTDDGTEGHHGLVTDLAEKQLEDGSFELVLGCGPELMLVKLIEICRQKNVPVQVSLERYMKCGVGICDSCAINGFHVCKDGPVFSAGQLAEIQDFGKWKRDATGRKVKL